MQSGIGGLYHRQDVPVVTAMASLLEDPASLTPHMKAELLQPESWAPILDLYARTARLAVALLDEDGLLVGRCHNPQPIWELAQTTRPELVGSCPFCLETSPHCTAADDAWKTESVTLMHDQAGLWHVALPLMVGRRHLGTLLAGQVVDRYPELLPMQRIARDFGLPPQRLWDLARQQFPVSRASLIVYGELLWALGKTFLRDRHGAIIERGLIVEATALNERLEHVNSKLVEKISQLDQLLKEKETLLKEVHHRVKNNLQVVSSLLSLQMATTSKSRAFGPLSDAYERIHSMALIYEQIYRSDKLSDLDFGEYIESLSRHLYESYCVDTGRIQMTVAVEPIHLTIDQAIPCGLILNELLSNALKHAFKPGQIGLLEVELRKTGDRTLELVVCDNGCGLPALLDITLTNSMGMQIVRLLAGQLEAKLAISLESGTRFAMSWTIHDALFLV